MPINLVIPCNLRARFLQEQVRESISEIDDRAFPADIGSQMEV